MIEKFSPFCISEINKDCFIEKVGEKDTNAILEYAKKKYPGKEGEMEVCSSAVGHKGKQRFIFQLAFLRAEDRYRECFIVSDGEIIEWEEGGLAKVLEQTHSESCPAY